MKEHEAQPDVPDLAMELQQGILSERRRHRFEASDQRELESHHGEPDEPDGD